MRQRRIVANDELDADRNSGVLQRALMRLRRRFRISIDVAEAHTSQSHPQNVNFSEAVIEWAVASSRPLPPLSAHMYL